MRRKEFIKICCVTCVSGVALTTFLQSCAITNHFVQHTIANNQIVIKKSEFIKTENEKISQRKFVLVKIAQLNYPICIFKINEEKYSALLMECSHKGCELNPQGDFLVCPCHGSEFNNTGLVQNPPAEENLKTFKTNLDNDYIYIQL